MRPAIDLLSQYALYHRDRRNIASHFVGVPMIVFAVGVLLDATGGDYAVAFSFVFVLQVLGVTQILRLRRRAARAERERLVASRVSSVHVPV